MQKLCEHTMSSTSNTEEMMHFFTVSENQDLTVIPNDPRLNFDRIT